MVGSVNVASKLDTAILMQAPPGDTGEEIEYTLVGIRDPGAVNGYGITYGVDGDAFEAWLNTIGVMREFFVVVTDELIAHYSDPANTHGFDVGLNPPDPPVVEPPEPPITAPPVNVDVPYAQQQGATLTCTMGNWDNVPSGYSYLWQIDEIDVGTEAIYPVQPDDVGHSGVCIVTATNEIGSTTAPPSNSVVIA